ncbi:hypothetical protein, partial [Shewanella sp. CG_4_10_14_0_8_um_filter_42_13]|uniref:hypothetical protein n=1 Tax=Shewanella sp. CG_4_10_14_0_8_um_filter_42_13 TaxID=1975534 RepID=UPI000CB7D84F
FEACAFITVNHLQWTYVQILLRDALRYPWPLNENVPVFDTLSRIYTGSCYLFDLASFGTNVKLTANLVLPRSKLGIAFYFIYGSSFLVNKKDHNSSVAKTIYG